ncbi:MAG: PhoH family protein [Duodenibacillus sp.]|nr:PhoH family protein [Duodenibacillus sp.]
MTETTKVLQFAFDCTSGELAALVGPLDENLRQIEHAFEAKITRRGAHFRLEGPQARQAFNVLEMLAARVHAGEEITINDVQMSVIGEQTGAAAEGDDAVFALRTRRSGLQPRTPGQKRYLSAIMNTDVTFGVGPAGTGKTYLAVAAAVDAYERDAVERIILTRPAIEAGERLGFLPGDLVQKVDPYLRPLYDALFDLFGFEKTQRLIEKQIIEIAPLAFMRGRTLNNAFVILDEAQNTTIEQMKMFLTRIGFGTRAVITGDATQIDLPRGVASGLKHACNVLEGVRGISIVHFTTDDVVRHPLVGAIVRAYEAWDAAHAGEKDGERGHASRGRHAERDRRRVRRAESAESTESASVEDHHPIADGDQGDAS